MAQVVTLSSVGTAAIILNPVMKSTTVVISAANGSSNSVVTVELTLDDPTIPGGPALTWGTLSSGAAMTLSSTTTPNLVYTVLSPIGGVRINSTANSSLAVYTLKALQSITA
jgi:hypothetical protein